jgi:hypothetical protein
MSYDPSQPLIGVTGEAHLSAAEAEASYQLAPLGIVPCTDFYPVTFQDAEGAPFRAKSDFIHSASGVLFEYKCGKLNSLKHQRSACSAQARYQKRKARGFINARNRQAEMLKAGWNHSLKKQAAVVAALTPAKVVLILKEEPDAKQAERLAKAGVFWRTLKNVPGYALFLRLASLGLAVGFTAQGHSFATRGLNGCFEEAGTGHASNGASDWSAC